LKKKICILTQSHLCRNPRVVKEAKTLAAAGFNVVILTTFTYPDLLAEDLKLIDNTGVELKGVVNMIPHVAADWYRLKERLVRRVAGEAISRVGYETVYALGYDFHKNIKAAVAEKADMYICHQEISTVIGCKLIERGFRVAFDFEDWYSHDLLPAANRSRPISLLKRYEKLALQRGILSYTTSGAMAGALGAFAETPPPHVLQNVFPFSDRNHLDNQVKDRVDGTMPSIHWYSQTIGPGRGIEFLVDCLSDIITPVEFHLRGNLYPDFQQELMQKFPIGKGHKLYLHPLVPHNELLSRIAEHDIGLATEEYVPDSRNLTITNKILQYLQAGIAVIASDTKGQQEVAAEASGAVALFRNKDRKGFTALLTGFLDDPEKLATSKKEALRVAQEKFCWEIQEKWLVQWVSNAINSRG
jgi:glycosyltransferase involved in cell wall biosynthesis